MGRIDEEDFAHLLRRLSRPRFLVLAQKVGLHLRILLSGNRGAPTVAHAKFFHLPAGLLFRGDYARNRCGVLGR